jgi:hypothetical protein
MRYPLVLMILPLLAMGACEQNDHTIVDPIQVDSLAGAIDPARLSGTIYNHLFPLSTLESATVSWGDYQTISNAAGAWEILELPAGSDTVKVDLEGFEPESRLVVMAGEDQVQSFRLMPVDTVPPPAPLAFTVISSEGEFLQLDWEAPADSGDLAGYMITKSPGDPQFETHDISVNSLLDINVSVSREYNYTLYSRDPSGNLSAGLVRVGTVDELPIASQISMTEPTTFDSISMEWTSSPDDDFAFYKIYRSEDLYVDENSLLVFETATITDTTFVDGDVTANAVYRYRLYSYDQIGQSAASGTQTFAAQLLVNLPGYSKSLMVLPEPGHVLASDIAQGEIHLCDDTGTLLSSLDLGYGHSYSRWTPATAGQAWGFTMGGYLALVDLDPLVLDRDFESGLSLSSLAWLGGDSLILAMGSQTPTAPVIFDGLNMVPLDTLDILADMAPGCLLVTDPVAGVFFIAETEDDWTLSRVAQGDDFTIEESVNLPWKPDLLSLSSDGRLLIAYDNSDRLSSFPVADLSGRQDLQLETQFTGGSFTPDGDQWWGIILPLSSLQVRGYQLDFPGGSAGQLMMFDQTSSPFHCVMIPSSQRVLTSLSSGSVSICQYVP